MKKSNKYIKMIKEKIVKNKELLLGLLTGLIVTGTVVYASGTYIFAGDEVSYDDENAPGTLNATTVQGALDELYSKIQEDCMGYNVTVQVTNGSVTGESTMLVTHSMGTGLFTVSPDVGYGNGTVSCTNSQTATLSGNSLTITPTADTTCTVTYSANQYLVTASGSTTYYITSCPSGWSCAGNYLVYAQGSATSDSNISAANICSSGMECYHLSITVPSYDSSTGTFESTFNNYINRMSTAERTIYWTSASTTCKAPSNSNGKRYLCYSTCYRYGSKLVCLASSGRRIDGQVSSSTRYTSATKTVTYGQTYGDVPTLGAGSWYTESSGGTEVTGSTTVTSASNHTIYAH